MLCVTRQVDLAPFTTLGVGGPAAAFATYDDEEELLALRDRAEAEGLPLVPLGQGSNVVVADDGVRALVVRSSDRRITFAPEAARVTFGGGVQWDVAVDAVGARDWHGMECMAGIPGYLGAAPVQNVGAYGQETSDCLVSLRALDLWSGRFRELGADACGFGYRTSRFKSERGRWVITRVTLAFTPGGRPVRRYPDLERALGSDLDAYPLAQISAAVRRIRAGKGMLVDAADPDSRSAGSFFTNPVLPPQDVPAFFARCAELGHDEASVPSWPTDDGGRKVAAAWLIEQSGFSRGDRLGGAAISGKHPLALVNRDGATAADVTALAERITTGVAATFRVPLTPEPVFLGGGADPVRR